MILSVSYFIGDRSQVSCFIALFPIALVMVSFNDFVKKKNWVSLWLIWDSLPFAYSACGFLSQLNVLPIASDANC